MHHLASSYRWLFIKEDLKKLGELQESHETAGQSGQIIPNWELFDVLFHDWTVESSKF